MFWIIIFLIGLVGISVMLYREVSLIRKHELVLEDMTGDKTLVSREKVADITEQLWDMVRLNAHKSIISVLRSWVIVTHRVNKYIKDKLTNRPEGSENGTVSTFLTTVSDYKHKMKKMRERLKQRDE
jgi:hypothetical protein